MRTVAMLALTALLGACAITPAQLRQTGYVGDYEKSTAPEPLSNCLERRLRNIHGNIAAYRDVISPDRIDVVGRREDYGVFALMEISKTWTGSRVAVYVHPEAFRDKQKQAAAELLYGC